MGFPSVRGKLEAMVLRINQKRSLKAGSSSHRTTSIDDQEMHQCSKIWLDFRLSSQPDLIKQCASMHITKPSGKMRSLKYFS
ncbi:hypothetical protein [Moorena sp. SIO3I6]|uniref:hypothetical protein n=1 Tax=Moorena sp. SIO3I6 TaxID=2607831 RepID=UPI0013FABECA|nr:hypothetical protein [Moorena sp. SIO3I6]NEP27818.1 hypothetical protein [Moorena sp. SIO3I6]